MADGFGCGPWGSVDIVEMCRAGRVGGVTLLNDTNDNGAALTRDVLFRTNIVGHENSMRTGGAIDSCFPMRLRCNCSIFPAIFRIR